MGREENSVGKVLAGQVQEAEFIPCKRLGLVVHTDNPSVGRHSRIHGDHWPPTYWTLKKQGEWPRRNKTGHHMCTYTLAHRDVDMFREIKVGWGNNWSFIPEDYLLWSIEEMYFDLLCLKFRTQVLNTAHLHSALKLNSGYNLT